MSIVSTRRVSTQNHSNIAFGQRRKSQPVMSELERDKINRIVLAANAAKSAVDEKQFLYHMSECFRLSREVWRGRSL